MNKEQDAISFTWSQLTNQDLRELIKILFNLYIIKQVVGLLGVTISGIRKAVLPSGIRHIQIASQSYINFFISLSKTSFYQQIIKSHKESVFTMYVYYVYQLVVPVDLVCIVRTVHQVLQPLHPRNRHLSSPVILDSSDNSYM